MGSTMNLYKNNSLIFAITLTLAISNPNFHATEAAGFSIDLIHRDSLHSPSLLSPFEHVEAALQRSFNRAKTLIPADHSPQSPSTDIVPDAGEYLMRFALGTPKVEILAIADTGSDLTWIQCAPCRRCFKQKSPLFNPNGSSTYRPVPCRSGICNAIKSTTCQGSNGSCGYTVRYGDNSVSTGDVAIETVTLGQNASFPHIVVGCGHMTRGTFTAATSGIVGLGGGKESLVRQMGPSISGRFSYCLVPSLASARKPSKMHFGDDAVVFGAGVATTPIITKYTGTFYYLTLVGMTVGNQRFDLNSSAKIGGGGGGNIVIDSGTTLTFLPRDLYREVEAALKRQVNLRQIGDPQKQMKLCYAVTTDAGEKIPEITAHFKGADVKLRPYNTFMMTSKKALCLAFAPASIMPIFGNLAQMNFLIGYDLVKKTVSFKPTDCTTA